MNEAKQHLEGEGLTHTHWGKIIIAAEKRGKFTRQEIVLSAGWVTCACGKITSDIIRRSTNNAPEDEILASLGVDFFTALSCAKIPEAAYVLSQIETRAIIVAKQ